MIKVGKIYVDSIGVKHILAQTSKGCVAFISLETGNRWQDPVECVNGAYDITEEEFNIISKGENFNLVS